MKHVLTTCHEDGCSGCTIFDDGTRTFWTEGRNSTVQIVYADGRQETTDAGVIAHPVIHALTAAAEEYGYEPGRSMTPAETVEFETVRGWR